MGFLKLPAELRNNVYHLVLVHKEVIDVEPRSLLYKAALTQTCSEICNETLAIFLASNTFTITPTSNNVCATTKWIRSLGAHASLVMRLLVERHIILDRHCGCSYGPQCPPWHRQAYSQSVQRPSPHTLACQQSPALVTALEEAVEAGLDTHAIKIPRARCLRISETLETFSVAICASLELWLQQQLEKRGLDTSHLMAGYVSQKEQEPLPFGRSSSPFFRQCGGW